jgi:replicative DNA helicase
MMQSEEATATAISIVRSLDFHLPIHQSMFEALAAMYTEGRRCGDPMLAAEEFRTRGMLGRIGGGGYIHTCMNVVPTIANVSHYAKIVKSYARDRRLNDAGLGIVQLALTSGDNKAAQAAKLLSDACLDDAGATGPMLIGDEIDDTMADIERGQTEGPSTGFSDLDRLLHGLQPGVVTIAGRPGMGKSTVAVDFARSMAIHQKIPTLVFALEMSRPQLRKRIVSAESGVAHRIIRAGGNALSDSDWTLITEAMPRIKAAPLSIDDTAGLTIHEICARSRMHATRHGLGCVIVDHIGLCAPILGSRSSRTEEIGAVTKGLHGLFKDLAIPVIAVSQLNRGPEQRTDKRPQLSDLRESGNIEQDSTVVILVHRDDYYDKESPRSGEADFIVAKHRDGDTDTITVAAQLHYARFRDMAV